MANLDIDQHTAKLTNGNRAYITNQYFDLNQPFAVPRYGNACKSYICGRDYMKDVADAIRSANHFIFIADWQLDHDVELDQRGTKEHKGRLSELLADALQRGVHVRILCYDSVRYALDTHDDTVQAVLNKLPKGKGSIQVMLQNPNTSRNNVIWAGIKKVVIDQEMDPNINFSHHQKFVVVDGKIAFLGGIDLAYGRWETPSFNVVIDPEIHILNDAYNVQLVPSRNLTAEELRLVQKQQNGCPSFSNSWSKSGKLLDPETQPREPWNDVALKITGPGAYDVFVNFVLRWNSFAKTIRSTNLFDGQLNLYWFERQAKGHKSLVDPLTPGDGSAIVQICRSASSEQLDEEESLWDKDRKYIQDDWKQPNQQRRKIMREARKEWANTHQTSIRDAMINSISAAQAFIYIENQFFISNCGVDHHGKRSPAKNPIIAELAKVISRAIHAERAFHVWIVLPEHPEGLLEDKGTSSQTWWALQGIKHGNESLINRINATIFEKNKKKWGVDKPVRTNEDIRDILAMHGMSEKWRDYLTVLNLRNYGQTTKGVVTEMVYVHSKLTIVDDAVAIIGSANINDRSLNGDGDTELAAVIVDTPAESIDLGQGVQAVTRPFARELRIQLWKKLLGMLVDTPTTGVQKETNPPLGIKLEQPLDKATINGILSQAIVNRRAYNRVFRHTPRDNFRTLLSGRRKYPPLMKKVKRYEVNGVPVGSVDPVNGRLRDPYVMVEEPTAEYDFSKMPDLKSQFMNGKKHDIDKAIKELRTSVKGFLVEMPLDWGKAENNTPAPPLGMSQLIAENPANTNANSQSTTPS